MKNSKSKIKNAELVGRTAVLTCLGKKEKFAVPRVEDWKKVAKKISAQLKPGSILGVAGPLGAGKTTFIQALAHALGVTRRPQSPTFALLRSYTLKRAPRGIARLIHVDAYRIENPHELLALDLDEELSDGCIILVIEWPEKIESWLKKKSEVGYLTIK